MESEPGSRLVGGVSRLALVEPSRVVVLDLPALTARAEIGTSGGHNDVAFVRGDRLAILAPNGTGSTLHVVDPDGPLKLGEVVLRGANRIGAVTGDHVLVTGGAAPVIVDASAKEPSARPLAIRDPVTVSARLDDARFLVVSGGVVQEWDSIRCAPVRRVRVERPADCRFLGGNDKRLWLVGRDELDFVYLVTLDAKTTRRSELPEPVLAIAQRPSGDAFAMIGAETLSVYVVDLTGRKPTKLVERGPARAIAWVGHDTLALSTKGELALVHIPGDVTSDDSTEVEVGATGRFRIPTTIETLPPPDAPVSSEPATVRTPFTDRPATTKDHRASARAHARVQRATEVPPSNPGWRADCARWARAANVGVPRDQPLGMKPLDLACARLDLEPALRPALALLYGAYLGGERIAPLALARTIEWRWSEALGNGQLAATGIAVWNRGDIELADEVRAFLDERAPLHGTLADGAGDPHAVALIVTATTDLESIASWAAATAGAGPLLAARDEAPFEKVALEARLRGVTPFVRATARSLYDVAVVALSSAAEAEALALPVAGTSPNEDDVSPSQSRSRA